MPHQRRVSCHVIGCCETLFAIRFLYVIVRRATRAALCSTLPLGDLGRPRGWSGLAQKAEWTTDLCHPVINSRLTVLLTSTSQLYPRLACTTSLRHPFFL